MTKRYRYTKSAHILVYAKDLNFRSLISHYIKEGAFPCYLILSTPLMPAGTLETKY